ncbi:MAG: hypothetical protein N3A54_01495, partial [Patescibacteria group bacterium]|nr:hypothetical protein [Patescibacteria group bacterium]
MGVDVIYVVSDSLVHNELLSRKKNYVFDFSEVVKEYKGFYKLVNKADRKKEVYFYPSRISDKKKLIPIIVHNIPNVFLLKDKREILFDLFFSVFDVHQIMNSFLENVFSYYVCSSTVFFPFSYLMRTKEGRKRLMGYREMVHEGGVITQNKGMDIRQGLLLPFTVQGELLSSIGKQTLPVLQHGNNVDWANVLSFLSDYKIFEVDSVYDLSTLYGYGRFLVDYGERKVGEEVFFGTYYQKMPYDKKPFLATYLLDMVRWKGLEK